MILRNLIVLGCLSMCTPLLRNASAQAFPAETQKWTEQDILAQQARARDLRDQILAAAARGETSFTIPPGDYRFHPDAVPNLHLKNLKNFTIEAAGVTFWLYPFQRVDGILLEDCHGVTLRGLTVDYWPTAYPQGRITALDPAKHWLEMTVDAGFSPPTALKSSMAGAKVVHFTESGEFLESRLDWADKVEERSGGIYRVFMRGRHLFSNPEILPGTRIALADRTQRMVFNLKDSSRCTLEDITVFASPHMVFTEHFGAGGHSYKRCRVIRRPGTSRLLACNADVFHSIGVVNGPVIEDCELSWSADDLINIHGFLSLVYEQRSPDTLDVLTQMVSDLPEGTLLRFYDFQTQEPHGEARVVKTSVVDIVDRVSDARAMIKEKKVKFLQPAHLLRVRLDQPVEVAKYTLVTDDARVARGTKIRRNHFHDCYTRGVLLKCLDGVIEENRIDNIGIASIGIAVDPHFMEGPFSENILIRGNTITRNGFPNLISRGGWNFLIGAISVTSERSSGLPDFAANFGIRILENTITDSSAIGIFLSNVRGGEIRDNVIRNTSARPPLSLGERMEIDDPAFAILVAESSKIRIEGNRVESPGPYSRGALGFVGNVRDCGPQSPEAR